MLRLLQLGRQLPGVLLGLLRGLRELCMILTETSTDMEAAGN